MSKSKNSQIRKMRVEEKHANAKEKGCEKGITKSGPGFPAFFEEGEKGRKSESAAIVRGTHDCKQASLPG